MLRVERLDQRRGIALAQQAVGQRVDACLRRTLLRDRAGPTLLRIGQAPLQNGNRVARIAGAPRLVERGLRGDDVEIERALSRGSAPASSFRAASNPLRSRSIRGIRYLSSNGVQPRPARRRRRAGLHRPPDAHGFGIFSAWPFQKPRNGRCNNASATVAACGCHPPRRRRRGSRSSTRRCRSSRRHRRRPRSSRSPATCCPAARRWDRARRTRSAARSCAPRSRRRTSRCWPADRKADVADVLVQVPAHHRQHDLRRIHFLRVDHACDGGDSIRPGESRWRPVGYA